MMFVREMTICLYRKSKEGYAAHVRNGNDFGTDLFHGMAVRPQNWNEAETAARSVLQEMGLDVNRLYFPIPTGMAELDRPREAR